jgi:3-isopropylmalate/(R)-2-methylmalate dehydratase small subunit
MGNAMQETIRGRVIRLAFDDVNTDVITPGEFRAKTDDSDSQLSTLRPHVFRAIRPGLDDIVKPGDVFVVGKNFGCGSHREPAVQIFKVWGVQAVVTESAARIWFRNAIAAGLPVFELKDATKLFYEEDQIEIDMKDWRIRNLTRKSEAYSVPSFPTTVMRIIEADGILSLLKSRIDTGFAPKIGSQE